MKKLLFVIILLALNLYAYAYHVKYHMDPSSDPIATLGWIELDVDGKVYSPVGGINPGDSGYFDIPGDVSYPFKPTAGIIIDALDTHYQDVSFDSQDNIDDCDILFYAKISGVHWSANIQIECDMTKKIFPSNKGAGVFPW